MTEDRKQSLGEFLKFEREKRGLTIEQTSSATKIGLKILKQLEADQYAELPALPFVRGFIKNYGKFLGMDGEKLLKDYASFLDEHSRERPKRDAGHSGYAFEKPEGEQSRKILWGIMAGMLVLGGAVVFIFKPSLKRKHHSHVDKFKTNPGSGEDEGLENPNPKVLPTESPAVIAGAAPIPSSAPSPAASVVAQPTPAVTPSAHPVVQHEAPFIPPKVPLVLNPDPPVVAVITPKPIPTQTQAPVPAPVVSTAPSTVPAVAVVTTPEEDLKSDPLQTGTNYATKDINFRVVLKTKEDVWVRYQCDDKSLMKFSMKKDKVLVLRGKETIYFQTSNPDSITYKRGSGSEQLVSQSSERFEFKGNVTLAWPKQAFDIIDKKFKIKSSLPLTPGPGSTPLSE